MHSLLRSISARVGAVEFGVAAFAATLGLAAPAAASGFYQSYNVSTLFDIQSIVLYEQTAHGGGTTNSFMVAAPGQVMTDPFLKKLPITATYFLGSSELGDTSESPSEHLVVAFNNPFAADVISGGLDFSDLFEGFDESSLIGALDLLATPDLDSEDPGYADQMAAKDAASDLVFNFSDTLVSLGGAFGASDSFTLVAFSSGVEIGSGESFTTSVGGVPEPATWGLMILGFGGAGAMLRRRRRLSGFAAA